VDPQVNPFAVLSLIAAPAILTNACSVLAMSTSNRLARAADRTRELSKQLEETGGLSTPDTDRRLRELSASEQRTLQLVSALRSIYLALGSFAFATLMSLVGAVLAPVDAAGVLLRTLEAIAVSGGIVAVSALVHGSILLVRETRLVAQVLHERAQSIRARAAKAGPTQIG
jgi:hypothetical protein